VQAIHKESRKAAEILLEKALVATIPGSVFGAQGEGHLRFGYATTLEAIHSGLNALGRFLQG
jgi:aspartate aminotransferase